MAAYLRDKVIFVTGSGSPDHRGVCVALAEAGADVVVAGPPDQDTEVLLNSIANEVWAIGRRGLALGYDLGETTAFIQALEKARKTMGRVDLTLRLDVVGFA